MTETGDTTPGYPGTIYLQRRILGQSTWATLASHPLSAGASTKYWVNTPSYSADYRIYYAGYSNVASPSVSASVRVWVKRNLHDNWRRSTRIFYGKVTPSYGGRTLYIQKSTCASPTSTSCRWTVYKTLRTTATGAWSTRLPAYTTRTHFRGLVRTSNYYLGGYSNYYVTTYRS